MPAMDYTDNADAAPRHQANSTGLSVRFKVRQVRDEEKTLAEGRPIHVPKEFVEIYVLGDKTNIVNRLVEPYDKLRFEKEYAAFKAAGDQDTLTGQSLKDWPGIPESLAEDWIAVGVRTVEQLAAVPEQNFIRLGPAARSYQQKALKYLEASKMDAPINFLQAELDKRDAQIAEMQRKFDAQIAQLQGQMAPAPVQGAVPMTEDQAREAVAAATRGPLVRKKV